MYPLRAVAVIAKHCSGGIILGFEQFRARSGVFKRGGREQKTVKEPLTFPTPWNHLEAGVLFGLKLPLLVFREPGIAGGVFDNGVTDAFVHVMPSGQFSASKREAFEGLFLKWQGEVQKHYYRDLGPAQ